MGELVDESMHAGWVCKWEGQGVSGQLGTWVGESITHYFVGLDFVGWWVGLWAGCWLAWWIGWLVYWFGCLVGWLVGWLGGWVVGWSVGCSVGWLVGCWGCLAGE